MRRRFCCFVRLVLLQGFGGENPSTNRQAPEKLQIPIFKASGRAEDAEDAGPMIGGNFCTAG